jgi:hypothetical protein
MANTLNMALLTLAHEPQPTLLDIQHLFQDDEYRERITAKVDNIMVKRFWDGYEEMKDGQRRSLTDPLWRLDAFYNNNQLLSITCHPERLKLAEWIKANKIILVSLNAPSNSVPEQERYMLGASLVSQIEMVVKDSVIKDKPYMLYIDEVRHFVTTALPDMLSESRKYGLGLVLASQYSKQLVGDTLDAVQGNVSTLVSFEVGQPDAKALVPYMKPGFTDTDLVSMGQFTAAVSLRYQRERQPAFTMETLPPPGHEQSQPERESKLRKLSVETYTPKPYSEVMDWVKKRYMGERGSSGQAVKNSEKGEDEFFEPEA